LKRLKGCKKFWGKNWKKFVLIIGVIGVLMYFKNMIVVAFVNNQPIFRYSYIKELEAQGGQQVLDTLMTKALVLQEAKNKGIVIGKEEIEAEFAKIEEIAKQQGKSLDELLELQNIKKSEVAEQIKIQKIVEKIASEGIIVSDEEANLYLEENKDFLPEDSSPEELLNMVKEQLLKKQLNSNIQKMILELKEEAKIINWL
ncbi:MAG: SurA N-terminal domain-containing protein, partial [Patescibacteria group bacterium]|nr:SurA N-terminal domain-containing protein [Patescibacteria group bacterium]